MSLLMTEMTAPESAMTTMTKLGSSDLPRSQMRRARMSVAPEGTTGIRAPSRQSESSAWSRAEMCAMMAG